MAYILPQGRCTWWNPNQVEKKAGNGDEEDEMENSDEKSEPNDSENALIENNIRYVYIFSLQLIIFLIVQS